MSPRVRARNPSAAYLAAERAERERVLTDAEGRAKAAGSSWAEYRSVARLENGTSPLDAAAQQIISASSSGFWRVMTTRMFDPHNPTALLDDNERRSLSKATGAAGAFIVPTDFDRQILTAARPARVLGTIARQIPTPHGRAFSIGTATAHGTGAWTAESTGTTTATDETFAQVSLGAFKGTTKVIVSEELSEDAVDTFDAMPADELGLRLAMLEEPAFIAGDGSGKPLGAAHTSSGYPVVTAATGNTTTLNWAAFIAAHKALPTAYRNTATWVLSSDAFSNLAGLGATVWNPDSGTLLGRPYTISNDLPGAGASNRTVLFGDWQRAYAVRRVTGLALQRLDELHSDNGQRGYRLISRVDGRPTLTEAAVVLRHSAT